MSRAEEPLVFPCPSCRELAVARTWTGTTEVDTFDPAIGGWSEHHFEDTCARCAWSRTGKTRKERAWWEQHRTRDDRLFYTGEDKMLVGSYVGELRVEAVVRADIAPLERADSSRVLGWRLERDVSRVTLVTFATDAGHDKRGLRAIDLARGAVSIAHQRAAGSETARAVVDAGSDGGDPTLLVVEGPAAHLLVGYEPQWCANVDVVLGAIDEMWRRYRAALAAAFAACSPLLAATFDAMTAGLAMPVPPVEPVGVGLAMLARVAPSVHADVERTHEGADGAEIWRGVRPDGDAPFPGQIAGWIAANRDRGDAYYLRLRPGQVTMLARRDDRLTLVTDSYPPGDLVGLGARLDFAWAHRAAFVDGLSLTDGVLDGTARVRAPGNEPLTLVSIRGDHAPIVIEPRPSIRLGRSADNDVQLQHKLVSRRQSVLSARDDGWLVRDAESTSGTYVERERVAGDTPLCLGDRLDLGALAMLVT